MQRARTGVQAGLVRWPSERLRQHVGESVSPLHVCVATFATTTTRLAAPFSSSRPLRRKEPPPATKLDIANMLGSTTHTYEGTTPLELNLFEDPTGGLASGPAEEMTGAEVETQVRLLVPAYTPDLYRLLYTPFIDVMFVVVSAGLVPDHVPSGGNARSSGVEEQEGLDTATMSDIDDTYTPASPVPEVDQSVSGRRPEQIMVRWFTDGLATLKNPDFTRDAMGDASWRHFCHALDAFCAPMSSVEPVPRTVQKHGLREDLFVPLMRQISLNLVDQDTRKPTIASLPGFILGLANGRAPASLGLPREHAARVQAVAEVFLSAGQETGNTDLAYLGLQLVRANDMAVPYRFQKQLTNVFAASARIQTDWQFRATGQLVEAYPRWLDYFRKVAADNARALQAQTASAAQPKKSKASVSAASHTSRANSGEEADPFAEDEQARDYFASHRQDDLKRSLELQANVESAVQYRAPLLAPWLQRGTRKRHTTPPALASVASYADTAEAAVRSDAQAEAEVEVEAEAGDDELVEDEGTETEVPPPVEATPRTRTARHAGTTKMKTQRPKGKAQTSAKASSSERRLKKSAKTSSETFTVSF